MLKHLKPVFAIRLEACTNFNSGLKLMFASKMWQLQKRIAGKVFTVLKFFYHGLLLYKKTFQKSIHTLYVRKENICLVVWKVWCFFGKISNKFDFFCNFNFKLMSFLIEKRYRSNFFLNKSIIYLVKQLLFLVGNWFDFVPLSEKLWT